MKSSHKRRDLKKHNRKRRPSTKGPPRKKVNDPKILRLYTILITGVPFKKKFYNETGKENGYISRIKSTLGELKIRVRRKTKIKKLPLGNHPIPMLSHLNYSNTTKKKRKWFVENELINIQVVLEKKQDIPRVLEALKGIEHYEFPSVLFENHEGVDAEPEKQIPPPPTSSDMSKFPRFLFIRNLPFDLTASMLVSFLEELVDKQNAVIEVVGPKSSGVALVEMDSTESSRILGSMKKIPKIRTENRVRDMRIKFLSEKEYLNRKSVF